MKDSDDLANELTQKLKMQIDDYYNEKNKGN